MTKSFLNKKIKQIQEQINELFLNKQELFEINNCFDEQKNLLIFSRLIFELKRPQFAFVQSTQKSFRHAQDLQKAIELLTEVAIYKFINGDLIDWDVNNVLRVSDSKIDYFIDNLDIFNLFKERVQETYKFEYYWFHNYNINELSLSGISKLDKLLPNYHKEDIKFLINEYIHNYHNNKSYSHFDNQEMYNKCIEDEDIKHYNRIIGIYWTFQVFHNMFTKEQEKYYLDNLNNFRYITEDMFKYYKQQARSKMFINKITGE